MADALYTECPLAPQRGHIRLLRLHASSNTSAPLIGTILATTFEASRASYEALSYCWGDNARPETITLHVLNKGTQPGHPDPSDNAIAIQVRITRSLAEALADFRLPSSDRLLWADALCINQADNAEKSIQVRQMFDVYANSRRTLVYLGRGGSEEMQAAIAHRDYLRAVNARSESSADPRQTGDPPKAAESPQAADTGNLVAWDPAVGVVRAGKGTPASAEDESDCLDYRTVAALPDSKADVLFAHDPDIVNSWKNILERPWTTRAWTTQEFVAGPDVLMQLGAGEVTVTVEDLSNLARYLNHDQMWRGPGLLSIWAASAPFLHGPSGVYRPLASPTSVASKVFRMLHLRLSMSEGGGDTTIGQVIGCVRGPGLAKVLNTTDARDVLWSLLALSRHKAVEELQPNYDLGIDEVYRRFSLHIGTAEAGSSSSLLCLPLQMQTGTPSWRLAEALEPSREPRFYYNQHREWPRHRVWATANEQGTELTARGTLVDKIVRLAEYVEIEPPLFKGDGVLDIPSFISTTYMNLWEAASWPGLFVLQGESSDEAVFKFFRGISPFARPLEEPPLLTFNARWEQYAHLWCNARAKLRTPPLWLFPGRPGLVLMLDLVESEFFQLVRSEGWPMDMVRHYQASGADIAWFSDPRELTTKEDCFAALFMFGKVVRAHTSAFVHYWEGKRVGMTSRGHLCNVDEEARVGDWIASTVNEQAALILREGPSGAYSLVGKAYAHGLIEGLLDQDYFVMQDIHLC